MRKLVSTIFLLILLNVTGQELPPENWFNLHPGIDSIHGASVDRAYELLEGRKSRTVIVAVIDSGIDIDHEDLVGKIWKNSDEVPGNGEDDDNNGYVDDVSGWNFIGGKDGSHVHYDTYEITRQYAQLLQKYEYVTYVQEDQEAEFDYWKDIERKYKNRSQKAMREYVFYRDLRDNTARYVKVVKEHLGIEEGELASDTLKTIETENEEVTRAVTALDNIARLIGGSTEFNSLLSELDGAVEHFEVQVKYGYNIEYNTRELVGDDWGNAEEVGYGNADVEGPYQDHGTHVAGIIAADRENEIGIKGIANDVLIMPIRAVPNGDERDKDVAASIRYAVDNGAQVINMSFGKYFENRREVVDKAIRYAAEKGVLMICSAGNEGKDTDIEPTYPTPIGQDGNRATHWLTIGASSWKLSDNFIAEFSNYGQQSVDIFAPGVRINSTYPENKYELNDGTSMAAPVVSGVAALLLSYFPYISSQRILEIITQSARRYEDLKVKVTRKDEMQSLSDLSRFGGVIDAEKAVKLALQESKK